MLSKKQKKLLLVLFALGPIVLSFGAFGYWTLKAASLWETEHSEFVKIQYIQKVRQLLLDHLGPSLAHNQFIKETNLNWNDKDEDVKIKYTIDDKIQKQAADLLRSYKPDYGAVVVMDANTGAIKAMVSYEKGHPSKENLAMRGTYPAASVFKIVTATAALDKYKLSPDTLMLVNGANHTFYKQNVMHTKVNRWTREISLRDAFARSINTYFGRLTFEKMQASDIQEYADRFGFNQPIQTDIPFDMGITHVPQEKSYALAEIASGFNRITRMSPIQGAMIAASVAATGVMPVPYIVDSIKSTEGKVLWKSEPLTAGITMTAKGAEQLKELMGATITRGTSRGSFRALVHDKKFDELELGGKTGSLYGDNPRGKVDWFVGYAIGSETEKLAIAAITVNKEFWTVKSAYLAQSIFKSYFKQQFSEHNQKFFSAGLNNPQ